MGWHAETDEQHVVAVYITRDFGNSFETEKFEKTVVWYHAVNFNARTICSDKSRTCLDKFRQLTVNATP